MAGVQDDRCKERMQRVEKRQDDSDTRLNHTKESLDKLLGSISTAKWMIGLGLPLFAGLIISLNALQLQGLKDSIRRNEIAPINRSVGMINVKKKLRKNHEVLASTTHSPSCKLPNRNHEIKARNP